MSLHIPCPYELTEVVADIQTMSNCGDDVLKAGFVCHLKQDRHVWDVLLDVCC